MPAKKNDGRTTLYLSVPKSVHAWLTKEAKKENRTVNGYLTNLLINLKKAPKKAA